jgi:hypothetical protein
VELREEKWGIKKERFEGARSGGEEERERVARRVTG